MALQHIALNQIDEAQLQRLIDGRASETREIEYKRDIYGNADRDHAEYLADISSFANTVGGDLVIGMAASSGVPTAFAPLTMDPDVEVLRLENIARSGIQPRLLNLAIRAVPFAGGGFAVVVRVPRSYNPPHRVIRQGTGQNRFWARSSAGKYEPNVDELRLLFTRAPQLADRIRDFRFDRVAKVSADDTPVPLLDDHSLILHVIPFSAFDSRLPLPLGREIHWYNTFPPLLSTYPSNFRININGLLTLSNAEANPKAPRAHTLLTLSTADANAKAYRAYTQVFHTGIVEAVASSFIGSDPDPLSAGRLTALKTEACIVRFSYTYLQALGALGCQPPFALLVSLIGVKGVQYSFTMGSSVFEDEAETLDRDSFHFSEVIVDDVPADPYAYAKMLRPLLNEIANAAGRAFTPTFDPAGQFRLKVD
jgi:hypothetical protein